MELRLEIWFPQQDEVSVFLESAVVDPDEERFFETHLFTLFAARQLGNLGGSDPGALLLAEALTTLGEGAVRASVQERLGDVRLVPAAPSSGRKGFTAELQPGKRSLFKLKPHGFGLMGRGVGYYAPISVLALLASLLDRRSADEEYQGALGRAATYVGAAAHQGMLGITSQAEIATRLARGVWIEARQDGEAQDSDEDDAEDDATAESLLEREQLHARHDEPLSLQDEDGAPVLFRILRFDDPIDPTDDEYGADPGNRYVGVELEAVNESHDETAGSPLSVALVDDVGQVHDVALATRQPEFETCPYLEPQERQVGFVLFELAQEASPAQFALGFDDATSVGLWAALEGTHGASSPTLEPDASDPIAQIRRLGELRDEDLLTDDEFELKKNELLGRL